MSKNNIQRETVIVRNPPTKLEIERLKLEKERFAKELEFERLLGQITIKIFEYEQKNHGSSNNLTILNKALKNQEDLTIHSFNAERISTIQKKLDQKKDKLHQIIGNEELRKLCELKGEITKLKMKERMDAQFQ
nr:15492_t:CDS:2 [Entrophospora candida]